MGEYILVAFILKDKSDIPYIKDGMKSDGKEIIVKGKEVFFDEVYFKITHFRILDLSTFKMYDISVDDYCKGDLFILGLSNSVRDFYDTSSSKWKKTKILNDISLNFKGCHRIMNRGNSFYTSGREGLGFYNRVPFVCDNKPIYGDEIVTLQLDELYVKGLKIIINYITGDFGLYISGELLIGEDLAEFNMDYLIKDSRHLKSLNSIKDSRFGVLNVLLLLGFFSEDYYIHNNEYAILYNYPKDGVVLFPSSIKNILLLRNIDEVSCTLVVPLSASIKCLGDVFNLDSKYNIKLMLSSKLSDKDLKNLVVNIGACPYNFDRENVAERVRKDCGVGIEFY